MDAINSIKNAFLSIGRKPKDESLAIPVDGYAEDDENAERGKKRFFGFKLDEIQLLLDVDVRSEVINDAVITSVPMMPSYISGLCNVRGNLVPVYDMYEKLGLNTSLPKMGKRKILVLDVDENMAGIEIQEMITSLQFDEQDIQQDVYSENDKVNQFITYCYAEDGNHWFGFDYKKMFEIVK